MLDKHAPHFLWKVRYRNASPWFESIRNEFLKQRDKNGNWRENLGTLSHPFSKICSHRQCTMFQNLYTQLNVDFNTERIVL